MSVWLLPGQGAQKPGMGADFLGNPVFDDVVFCMSEGLGLDLATLMREGGPDTLADTYVAQALTMAVSVGAARMLMDAGARPDALVGFSLGQISALAVAGALSLQDATRLLRVRASAMSDACAAHPGAMLALLGCEDTDVAAFCEEVLHSMNGEGEGEGEVLVPANYNAPSQVVISGTVLAIDAAEAAWKSLGKKCARLSTAGGFHSSLMAPAAIAVGDFCRELDFETPTPPIICNTDACIFDVSQATERLARQVASGVLFSQSVQGLIAAGNREFVEVGYGKVLSGLVRKIDKTVARKCVGTQDEFNAYFE